MNTNFGSFPLDESWAPTVEISGPGIGSVPPERVKVDANLPGLFSDNLDPRGPIVIPAGRFVALGSSRAEFYGSSYKKGLADNTAAKMPLTLHDGMNTLPVGMATSQIFRQQNDFMADGMMPTFRKGFLAEVPFIISVNNAHGELRTGDRVTGYYGSTTQLAPFTLHRGKPVLWTEKRLYSVSATTATAVWLLTAAAYPGMQPTILFTYSGTGVSRAAATPTAALTWNGTSWVATLSGAGSAALEVYFTYGQAADQIAGQVTAVRNINEMLGDDKFMKWVENGSILDFPPAMQIRATTQVAKTGTDISTAENPSSLGNGQYRVANYPMSVHDPVNVYIQGTITYSDGTTAVYTGTQSNPDNWLLLPANTRTQDTRRYFIGLYHSVDWVTGIITTGANLTITAIRVEYSYLSDPREGAVLWGQGIYNLTDGRNLTGGATHGGNTVVPTDKRGVLPHLNHPDVVGALRVWVN